MTGSTMSDRRDEPQPSETPAPTAPGYGDQGPAGGGRDRDDGAETESPPRRDA